MDKLLSGIMIFIDSDNNMEQEKVEIIRYGLELLLLKVMFFLAAVIAGIMMGSVVECMYFLLLFIPLRSMGGGYHAKTRLRCFLLSMCMIIVVLQILRIISVFKFAIAVLGIFTVLFAAIVWNLSPVDTKNKRLGNQQRLLIKRKGRVLLFSEILLSLVLCAAGYQKIFYVCMLSIIMCGILEFVEYIGNKVSLIK